VIDANQLSRDTVAGITSIDLPQLLLSYPLRRQTIAVFLENIIHAAIGSVRLLVKAAIFLLMAVCGLAHGHHFLPAVTHLLFLHVEYPSRCGGENGLQAVLSPILLLPNFRRNFSGLSDTLTELISGSGPDRSTEMATTISWVSWDKAGSMPE